MIKNTIFIEKQFISIDNKHCIKTTIIEDTIYFNIVSLELESYKTFLLTLKKCFDYTRNLNFRSNLIWQIRINNSYRS
jgi:hypothetical protein